MLFRLLNLPLPWLLGSLTSVLLWSLAAKRNLFWPMGLRNGGLAILGYMLGSSFTVATGLEIFKQLPAMFLATASIVLVSLLVGAIISRCTGLNPATSILGSVPGGLTQMVVLSEEIPGSDLTVVTFMQTIRLLSTVFIVPFIVIHGLAGDSPEAGAAGFSRVSENLIHTPWNALIFVVVILIGVRVGQRINLPTPFLLGPLLGTAVLVLTGLQAPDPPSIMVLISQLCIGAYLGLSIQPARLENWKRLLPCALGGSIAVVFCCLGTGYLLTLFHPLTLTTAFLGTSPGGMGEMGLTAVLVGADVSLVAAYQLFRLSFILFALTFLLKRYFTKRTGQKKHPIA
jgi:hypothetical protein